MLKKIEPFLRKYSWTVAAVVAVLGAILFAVATCVQQKGDPTLAEAEAEPLTMYDIPYEQYELVEGEVGRNETIGGIFERFGVGPSRTYLIEQAAKDSFDLHQVQAGRRYTVFLNPDSVARDSIISHRMAHFVYEKSQTAYFVISLVGDSVIVRNGSKRVRTERCRASAEITSSMWNAIVNNGLPPALAVELEDVYGWSVDFFGLQKGDHFEVIYDRRYIDTVALDGVGQIWGASFTHRGKTYYAVPFKQDGKIAFWDENGNSLKKQFLRAPLKTYRITSHFSLARRHPITRVVRPHLGIDYGAPSGTPVSSVADGTVTRRYYDNSGGGNTVWIKHARGYETGYLHLSKFGNISVGSRVSQGQIIGYVGSTGSSTGPHLDYRIRVNGKAINPLSIPQEPGEPIRASDRERFAVVRDKVMGELAGTLPEAELLLQLDSIAIPSTPPAPVNPSPVDTTRNVIDGAR